MVALTMECTMGFALLNSSFKVPSLSSVAVQGVYDEKKPPSLNSNISCFATSSAIVAMLVFLGNYLFYCVSAICGKFNENLGLTVLLPRLNAIADRIRISFFCLKQGYTICDSYVSVPAFVLFYCYRYFSKKDIMMGLST